MPARLRRAASRLTALFPCRESALLTGLMLITTTLMLAVQFPDLPGLRLVNAAGYAALRGLFHPGGYLTHAQAMLLTGGWFVLVTALPLIFSAVGG